MDVRLARRALLIFGGGLLVLIVGLAGLFAGRLVTDTAVPMPRIAIGGPFQLTDQNGQAVTEKSYPGRYLLVFFGYTYCPDVCPTTLGALADALGQLGPLADKLQPLFVSVDPDRDTPAVLKAYTGNFDKRIIGLTGTADQIRQVAKAYRVYYARHGDGSDYTMDHSAVVYLMAPDGRFLTTLPPDMPPEQMAALIKSKLQG